MSQIVRKLVTLFTVETDSKALAGFEREIGKAKKSALGLAAAATGAGVGLFKLAQGAAKSWDSIEKGAAAMGSSAEDYQRLRHIAKQTGADVKHFMTAFDTFKKKAEDAKDPTSDLAGALKELGVEALDSEGNVRDIVELYPEISDGLSRVEDKTKRAALQSKLFGSRIKYVRKAFELSSDEIERYNYEAEKLGLTSEERIAQGKKFQEQLNLLTAAFGKLKSSLGGSVIPAFTELMAVATEWILENREILSENISKVMESVAKSIFAAAKAFAVLVKVTENTIGLDRAMKLLIVTFAGLKAAAIVKPFYHLSKALVIGSKEAGGFIALMKTGFGPIVKIKGALASLSGGAKGLIPMLKGLAVSAKAFGASILAAAKGAIVAAAPFLAIAALVAVIAGAIYTLVQHLRFGESSLGNFLKRLSEGDGVLAKFAKVALWFYEVWTGIWDNIAESVRYVLSGIQKAFAPLWTAFKPVLDKIGKFAAKTFELLGILAKVFVGTHLFAYKKLWQGVKAVFGLIGKLWQGMVEAVKSVFGPLIGWFEKSTGQIGQVFKALTSAVLAAFQLIVNSIKAVFGPIVDWFDQKVLPIKAIFKTLRGFITDQFKGMVDRSKALFTDLRDFIKAIFGAILGIVKKPFDLISKNIDGIRDKLAGFIDKASEIPGMSDLADFVRPGDKGGDKETKKAPKAGDAKVVKGGVPFLDLQDGDIILDQDELAKTVHGRAGDFVPETVDEAFDDAKGTSRQRGANQKDQGDQGRVSFAQSLERFLKGTGKDQTVKIEIESGDSPAGAKGDDDSKSERQKTLDLKDYEAAAASVEEIQKKLSANLAQSSELIDKNFRQISDRLPKILSETFSSLSEGVKENLELFEQSLSEIATRTAQTVETVSHLSIKTFKDQIQGAISELQNLANIAAQTFGQIFDGLNVQIQGAKDGLGAYTDDLTQILGDLEYVANTISGGFQGLIDRAMGAILPYIQQTISAVDYYISEVLGSAFSTLQEFQTVATEQISQFYGGLIELTGAAVVQIGELYGKLIIQIIELTWALADEITQPLDAFTEQFLSRFAYIEDAAQRLGFNISDTFRRAAHEFGRFSDQATGEWIDDPDGFPPAAGDDNQPPTDAKPWSWSWRKGGKDEGDVRVLGLKRNSFHYATQISGGILGGILGGGVGFKAGGPAGALKGGLLGALGGVKTGHHIGRFAFQSKEVAQEGSLEDFTLYKKLTEWNEKIDMGTAEKIEQSIVDKIAPKRDDDRPAARRVRSVIDTGLNVRDYMIQAVAPTFAVRQEEFKRLEEVQKRQESGEVDPKTASRFQEFFKGISEDREKVLERRAEIKREQVEGISEDREKVLERERIAERDQQTDNFFSKLGGFFGPAPNEFANKDPAFLSSSKGVEDQRGAAVFGRAALNSSMAQNSNHFDNRTHPRAMNVNIEGSQTTITIDGRGREDSAIIDELEKRLEEREARQYRRVLAAFNAGDFS